MLHHNETMRGWILLWMGRLSEAEETCARAGEGAAELGDPRNAAHAFAGLGHVRWLLGDAPGAWKSFHRAEEHVRRFGGPRTVLMIKGHELHPLADVGRWSDVRQNLAACWEASDATGGSFLRAQLYAWEGWLALRDDDRRAASRWFDQARECAGDVRTERWYALCVELLACAEAGLVDRLVDIADALHDVGADNVCARALGQYARVSAWASGDLSGTVDAIERAGDVEADLPPVYRRGWWREIARLHERHGRYSDAAAARARAERAASPPTSTRTVR